MRQARLAAGLSLEDVARELGVTRTSVSEWELNKKFPRMEHLPILRRILFVTLDKLICGDPFEFARKAMSVGEAPSPDYLPAHIPAPDIKTALRANAMRGLYFGLTEPQQEALIDLLKAMQPTKESA